MDDMFSSYLLTTRGEELNEVCKQVADFEDLQNLQLIHQKGLGFIVELSVGCPHGRCAKPPPSSP